MTPATDRLIPVSEVSRYVPITPDTLFLLRKLGTGPRSIRIGSRSVYRLAELVAWSNREEKQS